MPLKWSMGSVKVCRVFSLMASTLLLLCFAVRTSNKIAKMVSPKMGSKRIILNEYDTTQTHTICGKVSTYTLSKGYDFNTLLLSFDLPTYLPTLDLLLLLCSTRSAVLV